MRRLHFALIYWAIILVSLGIYSITDGNERKTQYEEVEGLVVDLVPVRKQSKNFRSYEALMPQVSYPVGDTQYLFVDHSVYRKVGSKPTILYKKNNPQEARIYNLFFWFDFGVIVPAFLISGFVFSIVLIAMTPDKRRRIILPGHLDNISSF